MMAVTRSPHDLRIVPMLLAMIPLPMPEMTPPVTRIYFIGEGVAGCQHPDIICAVVVAPCREAGAGSAPRPAWRSPVELGRGPPLGLSGVATGSFLPPALGHGVCRALLAHLPLSAWPLAPLIHASELGFAAVFCAMVQNKRLKSDSSGHQQLPSPPALSALGPRPCSAPACSSLPPVAHFAPTLRVCG